MKGFIEVHEHGDADGALLNIDSVEIVFRNTIYLRTPAAHFETSRPYIKCRESYEEIKRLIQAATE